MANAPTTADDKTRGFYIGSFWVDNEAGELWQAQSVAVGAAVWVKLANTTIVNTIVNNQVANTAMILADDWQTGVETGLMGWQVSQGGGAATWVDAQQTTTIRGVVELRANNGNVNNRCTLTLWNAGLPFIASRQIGFTTWINLQALGDGTNPYRIRLGFGDIIPANSTTDQDNGFYFEYDSSLSANWRCKTAAAAARTISTTSTAVVASTWMKLSARVNAAVTAIDFYINDVLKASVAGTLPTALGQDFAPLLSITRHTSNGTLQRSIYVDSFVANYLT